MLGGVVCALGGGSQSVLKCLCWEESLYNRVFAGGISTEGVGQEGRFRGVRGDLFFGG